MSEIIIPSTSVIERVAQESTNISDLTIDKWEKELLSEQGQRRIFRLSGIGSSYSQSHPWSLILKQIKAPEDPDAPDADFEHVAYWEREYLLYESGIPQSLERELRSPIIYATMQPDPSLRWIWMENLHDFYQRKWPDEFFAKSAYRLGYFNGQYLTGEKIAEYSLIGKDTLRQRMKWYLEEYQRYREPKVLQHPLVQKAYPTPVLPALDQLASDYEKYLDILKEFPHALCHLDAWHGNMAAVKKPNGNISTVLFDWALVGYGAPGREISNMIWTAPLELVLDIDNIDELEELLFYQYLHGLKEAGWDPNVDHVRIAYLISSVLIFGFALESIDHALNEEWYEWDEEQYGMPIEEIVCRTGQVTYRLLERVEELNSLLKKLNL